MVFCKPLTQSGDEGPRSLEKRRKGRRDLDESRMKLQVGSQAGLGPRTTQSTGLK